MSNSKYLTLLILASVLLTLPAWDSVVAQVIEFPLDNGGWVTIRKTGYMLEISGTAVNGPVPSLEELITHNNPSCAHFNLVAEWDCGNPWHGDYRTLIFYKRLQIWFDKVCKEDLCFGVAGHPELGEICFNNNQNKVQISAIIEDACGTPLRDRPVFNSSTIDLEEDVMFYATLTCEDEEVQLPENLYGTVSACGLQYYNIYMVRGAHGPGFAEYKSGVYTAGDLAFGCPGGSFVFEVTYGRIGRYAAYMTAVGFAVEEINFSNNIILYDEHQGLEVCYPHGVNLSFGTTMSVNLQGWPGTCQHFTAKLNGYRDGNYSITTQGEIQPGEFDTNPAYSDYQINPPFRSEILHYTWKTVVEDGPPERNTKPVQSNIKVYHGFKAGDIRFDNPPEEDKVFVGVEYLIFPTAIPYLAEQERIKYCWFAEPVGEPGGEGSFVFGDEVTYLSNKFKPTKKGDIEIYYKIKDTATGYESEPSTRKLLHILEGLVIDSPSVPDTFWITDVPAMPSIVCKAHIKGVPLEEQTSLKFNWTIKLHYRNNDWDLERKGTVQGINDWNPDFGTDFGGGEVIVDVGVKYGSDSLTAHIIAGDRVRVLGRNPEDATVLTYISNISSDDDIVQCTRGCARMETASFTQFRDDGYPLRSGDGGYGIMQLTSGGLVGRNQIWNWHSNVQAGADYISDLQSNSEGWFSYHRPGYTPTEEQLHKDIYRRYNAGIRYYDYIESDPWFVRDQTYADDCGENGCSARYEHKADDPQGNCYNSGCCYADLAYGVED